MSEIEIDIEELLTPPELMTKALETEESLLPLKSKKLYEKCYEKFMAWRLTKNAKSFSENVLLAYFNELSQKCKPSTLWTEYSMLKLTLKNNHQTNLSNYSKLYTYLKRQADGFKGEKSKVFLPNEVKTFLETAPDQQYLATKVALVLGIMGACRRQELQRLQYTDVKDLSSTLLVNITNTKTKIDRNFTVTGKFYEICKSYMDLRPNPCKTPNFFLRYSNGHCSPQNVGINTFGQMGKTMATFFKLANPELYTGHCFRRTSATILIDAGGDITTLKRHGGWKSTTVAEGYIDNSLQSKIEVSNKILSFVENQRPAEKKSKDLRNEPCTSNEELPECVVESNTRNAIFPSTFSQTNHSNKDVNITCKENSTPVFNFTNCTFHNFNINK